MYGIWTTLALGTSWWLQLQCAQVPQITTTLLEHSYVGLALRAGVMPEVFGDGAKSFPAQRGKMLSREFNYTLMWIFGCRILMVHPSFSPLEDSLWSSLSSLTGGLWSTLLYALAQGIQTWPSKHKPPIHCMIMTAVLRIYHGKIPKVFSLSSLHTVSDQKLEL